MAHFKGWYNDESGSKFYLKTHRYVKEIESEKNDSKNKKKREKMAYKKRRSSVGVKSAVKKVRRAGLVVMKKSTLKKIKRKKKSYKRRSW